MQRSITIIFADITNSVGTTNRLDLSEYDALVGALRWSAQTATRSCMDPNHAPSRGWPSTHLQVFGDEALLCIGTGGDGARHAVHWAVELQWTFANRLRKLDLPTAHLKVGIDVGEAALGIRTPIEVFQRGKDPRGVSETTYEGLALARAKRVQTGSPRPKWSGIFLSREVVSSMDDSLNPPIVDLAHRGEVCLKGFPAPTIVWEVKACRSWGLRSTCEPPDDLNSMPRLGPEEAAPIWDDLFCADAALVAGQLPAARQLCEKHLTDTETSAVAHYLVAACAAKEDACTEVAEHLRRSVEDAGLRVARAARSSGNFSQVEHDTRVYELLHLDWTEGTPQATSNGDG